MNLWPFVFALFALGIFCLLTRRNLIKILIGLELLSKGATLALIWSGILRNSLSYTQSLAVIAIAIEVMVVAVFLALVYASERADILFRYLKNGRELVLDTREIKAILNDVPLSHPSVIKFLREFINEKVKELERIFPEQD